MYMTRTVERLGPRPGYSVTRTVTTVVLGLSWTTVTELRLQGQESLTPWCHHLEPQIIFSWFKPGIYLSSGYARNISGTSLQYDFRIKSCFHPFEYVYCFDEYVQCTELFCCGMKSPSFNVIWWYTEQWDNWNIPCLCTVYARNIHQFGLIDLSEKRKGWNCHHESELVCTDHYQSWGHDIIPQNAFFIQHEYLTGAFVVQHTYME